MKIDVTSIPRPEDFPTHLDVDAVLRSGGTVHVRPITPTDGPALESFFERLSEESRILRFFGTIGDLTSATNRFLDVDYRLRLGMVALHGYPEQIVAHGMYAAARADRAEVALAVADELQGQGLGTILLGYLAETAAAAGISTFEAEVLPRNHRMIAVFRDSGFRIETRSGAGMMSVEFPTSTTGEAAERFAHREHISGVAALKRVFEPSSIAVIGASRRRGSIGGEVFRNLLDSGFPGPVYPVSPHPVVQSVPAYPSVEAISGPVDLGVVVVPAPSVLEAARGCARKGVQALVVISSGFAETGGDGRQRQLELLEVCRQSGMRLVGPNCMGVLNTAEAHRMNATFAPSFPPSGRVGFMSQSGALGLAVIDKARGLGLGLATFASVGNKADISGNDLLEYWEDDANVDLILLYLESFGNPRRFSRLARRIGRTKPILAVKSGRSTAGLRATSSHTGALLAASDATVDALFEQSGVIRCETLSEMFDVASVLANQPPPGGGRVGIVTNAGGLGILCADACSAAGLEVPELSPSTQSALRSFLAAEASIGNPVDMIASARGDDYERSMTILAESGDVDAIIVIFIPPLVTPASEVAGALRRVADSFAGHLPILAVFTSTAGAPALLREGRTRIPAFAFPEEAARALGKVRGWGRWREAPTEKPHRPEGARSDEAHALISQSLGGGSGWLRPEDTMRLLDCYGIEVAPWRVGSTPEEAAAKAAEIGGSVALKAVGDRLLHKTELGAVRLGLATSGEVLEAAREMGARLSGAGVAPDGWLVQRMVSPGVEMIVGMVQDPVFGPVLACGAGGTAVELLKDVRIRLSPLCDGDADAMIRGLATFPLLDGYRGAPKANVPALKDLLLRLSVMVEDQQAIVELDLNPVIVTPEAAVVADARIRVEWHDPRPPMGARPRPA